MATQNVYLDKDTAAMLHRMSSNADVTASHVVRVALRRLWSVSERTRRGALRRDAGSVRTWTPQRRGRM